MTIKVVLFGVLREMAGREELQLEFMGRVPCERVMSYLRREFKSLGPILRNSRIAVNAEYKGPFSLLNPGDEVAVLPPIEIA